MRVQLISLLLMALGRGEITFSVEEPDHYASGHHRRSHRVRHAKGSEATEGVPYRAAVSTVTGPNSDVPEQFSLNCPHVADASNEEVKIEVVWTLDDTIWLKIRDGEKKIVNRMTSFNKRTIAGKTLLRVTMNDGRYFFNYDELTGDFVMEISPVIAFEDAGVWQCHVTVFQGQQTQTLTSRSRVKLPPGASPTHLRAQQRSPPQSSSSKEITLRPIQEAYFPPAKIEYGPPQSPSEAKISSFTRQEQNTVQISRDSNKRRQTVVFDRSVTKSYPTRKGSESPSGSARFASIDYEMSMAEDDEPSRDAHFEGGPRVRAASYFSSAHLPCSPLLPSFLYITLIMYLRHALM